jgi:hypothetical protein
MQSMIDALKASWEQHVQSTGLKELPPDELARRRLVYWAGWKAALQHIEEQTMAAARAATGLRNATTAGNRELNKAAKALADALPEEWW